MLIASYCKTIPSTDTEIQKNVKSGIGILLYNFYTAYIQRFKLFG